jgi:hypothetical protein
MQGSVFPIVAPLKSILLQTEPARGEHQTLNISGDSAQRTLRPKGSVTDPDSTTRFKTDRLLLHAGEIRETRMAITKQTALYQHCGQPEVRSITSL